MSGSELIINYDCVADESYARIIMEYLQICLQKHEDLSKTQFLEKVSINLKTNRLQFPENFPLRERAFPLWVIIVSLVGKQMETEGNKSYRCGVFILPPW